MIANWEIRKKARESLKGKWTTPVVAQLVLLAISIAIGMSGALPGLSIVLNILVSGALAFGMVSLFLLLVRNKKHDLANMFDGFKILAKTIPLSLWMFLFILLWALLLIIPGIIAAFRYSMSYYILYDSPKIAPKDALKKSSELMLGYKWSLFCLWFSFLGWYLLGILTLGVAWLWVASYQNAATAIFYEELKKEKTQKPGKSGKKK